MGAVRTGRPVRPLAILLVLRAATMTHTACAQETSPAPADVVVLCTPDLSESVPSCGDVAAALEQEIEDYGLHAETAAWPGSGVPGADHAAGVQFTVWEWVDGTRLVIHVADHANDIEISKSLDLALLAEFPAAEDIAILAKTLMSASLFTSLASLPEDGPLAALAVPPAKKAIAPGHATPSAPQPPPAPAAPRWAPQFALGWGVISYPGQHNDNASTWDTYNGLALAIRFPLPGARMWMGFSVAITQSLEGSPAEEMQEALEARYAMGGLGVRVLRASTYDDQLLMALDLAWIPVEKGRFRLWLSAGPGLTRVSWKLLAFYEDHASPADGLSAAMATLKIYRVTLGGGFGLAIGIVDRVGIEAGLRASWCYTLGEGGARVSLPSENDYVYTIGAPIEEGAAGLTFWFGMVFG